MAIDSQQKSATFAYRAGTKHGPSFDLKDKSIDEVWLVTNSRLFFPLGQDLPICIEEVCLWRTNVSNLSEDFICNSKYDGVIRVELNGSRNSKNSVKEIQTRLKSLEWEKTAVPRCRGGFSQMNVSPLVQAMMVYMKDHYPNTPEELNFHAELKAASQWCWSDDCKQVVVKKVPVGDCRLKIAATETLKTWEEKEKDLQRGKTDEMKKLSDFREAIGVLKNYIEEDKREPIGVSKNHLGGDKKDMEPILAFPTPPATPEKTLLVTKRKLRFEQSPQQPKAAARERTSAAGRKSPRNGSPKKRKHEANGVGTFPPKKVKPARQRFPRRVSKRRHRNVRHRNVRHRNV